MGQIPKLAALAAILSYSLSVPALGEKPTTQPNAKASDPNEVVCERQESTGSRLQSKKVCMTRAQWADKRLQDRQDLERVQRGVCVKSAGC